MHSYAVDVIMEDNTIKGVVMESKSGRRVILAERVIDCTGDADVAFFAGAEYSKVKAGAPIGAWKCNFPTFFVNYDRPIDRHI